MAFRRSNTMYDAMMSGISGLGGIADAVNGAKKQESELKLHAAQLKESEQTQALNKQKIDANKETMAQVLARKQLIGSLEDGGSLAPGAMTGTGPGNNVNMDEIKAGKKFDQEAKLWNSLNQDKEGFVPVTGKKLKELAESRGLEANKADQKGVAADELQSQFSKDPALGDTEKAFYANKPEAYGERLKPMGVTYLPGADGFAAAPSKMLPGGAPAAPAARVKDDSGAPVIPRAPPAPAETKWVSKVDAEGNTYQENPVTGETRDTGRKAAVKAGAATSSPDELISKADQGIAVLDQMVGRGEKGKNHSGFESAVGAKGLSSFFGARGKPVDGSAAADFQALLDQVGGQAFLESRQALKGGGPITDMEGKKAQSAVTRMSTAQSEAEFKKALNEYRDFLIKERADAEAKKKARAKPSGPATPTDDDPLGLGF